MATSIASALLKVPVRRDVAMTGEITLRGRVMPIGGLKEKILAAHRSDIHTVIVPRDNRKDLREIPKRVLKATRVILVDHMDDVLREALVAPPQALLDRPSRTMEYRDGVLVTQAGEPTVEPVLPAEPEAEPVESPLTHH